MVDDWMGYGLCAYTVFLLGYRGSTNIQIAS